MTSLDELFYSLLKSDSDLRHPTCLNRLRERSYVNLRPPKISPSVLETNDNNLATDFPDTITIVVYVLNLRNYTSRTCFLADPRTQVRKCQHSAPIPVHLSRIPKDLRISCTGYKTRSIFLYDLYS